MNYYRLKWLQLINDKGIKANATDSRHLIKTDDNFGNAQPIAKLSKDNVTLILKNKGDTVNVVTGFIASNLKDETTTLGTKWK